MNGPTHQAKPVKIVEAEDFAPRPDAALKALRSDRDVWHAVALDAIAERDKLRAAIKRQAHAARTLQSATLATVKHIEEKGRSEYHAAATVESEREANAILTAQIESLEARFATLKKAYDRERRRPVQLTGGGIDGPPFNFTRYVDGIERAEGVRINRAATLEEAISKATCLCPDTRTVLVYVPPESYNPVPTAWTSPGSLDAMRAGKKGYIFPTPDEDVPIPLYAKPPL